MHGGHWRTQAQPSAWSKEAEERGINKKHWRPPRHKAVAPGLPGRRPGERSLPSASWTPAETSSGRSTSRRASIAGTGRRSAAGPSRNRCWRGCESAAGHQLGWQPSRFLTDRAEAERAFALAERLGSVNAAAQELGTTWPSLCKAFTRHGLGMPARNPQAVRQRAIDAARQRHPQPSVAAIDPVFVALNHGGAAQRLVPDQRPEPEQTPVLAGKDRGCVWPQRVVADRVRRCRRLLHLRSGWRLRSCGLAGDRRGGSRPASGWGRVGRARRPATEGPLPRRTRLRVGSSPPSPPPAAMEPHIRFCVAPDGVRLAFASHGQGPPLVRAATWLTHLEVDWQSPLWRHWLEGWPTATPSSGTTSGAAACPTATSREFLSTPG